MPSHRPRRLVQGQGGSTLIELLIAMSLAVMLLGPIIQSLGTAGRDQQDIEGRTEALTNGQIGLERMTRELRQANWLYFRSSAVVDLDVNVRATPTSTGTRRLVRWDCSTGACLRSEGSPVTYPPPAAPSLGTAKEVIGGIAANVGDRNGQIVNHDVFKPYAVDKTTGARSVDFVAPDYLMIRIQLSFRDRNINYVNGKKTPIVLEDGVSLRNRTNFAA